jgi:hypothetical protein
MGLAFDLLLTLLIELPIIALFFKRKKRPKAMMYGLLVNLISWPLVHIIKMYFDINTAIVEIAVVTGEGIGLWLLTGCGWKKGLLMSATANCISFLVTSNVHIDADMFQHKTNIIIHANVIQ